MPEKDYRGQDREYQRSDQMENIIAYIENNSRKYYMPDKEFYRPGQDREYYRLDRKYFMSNRGYYGPDSKMPDMKLP